MCQEVEQDCDALEFDKLFNSQIRIACLSPQNIYIRGKPFNVPCGKCYLCEKKRKLAWVNRLCIEAQNAKSSFFITLTYADEYVPVYESHDLAINGEKEYIKINILQKSDAQLFFKRLRKHLFAYKLRYFLVGEYGPKTLRPHYHFLLFLDDYIQDYVLKDVITKCWPIGFNVTKQACEQNIQYCAKYCISIPDLPDIYKIAPQFMLCSKGIGKQYVTDEKIKYYKQLLYDKTKQNQVNLFYRDGYQYAMPRYYKDKLFTQFEKNQIRYMQECRTRETKDIERKIYSYLTNENNYERNDKDNNQRYLQYYQKITSFIRNLKENGERWKQRNMKSKKI